MLVLSASAVLSLIVAVSGAVVPKPNGVYRIVSAGTGHAIDLYRDHPFLGDPIVSATASESDTQNWNVTFVDRRAENCIVTFSGAGANETIHVAGEEGDGLETAGVAAASAFVLERVPDLTIPLYWLTLGEDEALAVTGYTRRSQLTLERLVERDVSEAWAFHDIPSVAQPANKAQT